VQWYFKLIFRDGGLNERILFLKAYVQHFNIKDDEPRNLENYFPKPGQFV
jgi:hypothetical protein